MKKLILLFVLSVSLATVSAQSITRGVTLKTTDLGNQRLEAFISEGDTIYRMVFKASESPSTKFVVILGERGQAEHILNFLLETKIDGKDIIDLENPTHNLVGKNSLGGYRIYSEGKAFSQQLRKPNIKGFLKAIADFCR